MSNMTQTFEIFKQLQSTTKKNEKIAILEANKTDICVKDWSTAEGVRQ